eukprot:5283036-Amphidinium_carterae.1
MAFQTSAHVSVPVSLLGLDGNHCVEASFPLVVMQPRVVGQVPVELTGDGVGVQSQRQLTSCIMDVLVMCANQLRWDMLLDAGEPLVPGKIIGFKGKNS